MQIEQQFQLPQPPQAVWQAFEDIALMVECLPGAALTGAIVDGAVPLRFDVRLGPIKAGFVGNGQVKLDAATRSGRFDGAAADRSTQSRVKGQAQFAVSEHASGSTVAVTVDYALTGSLAQFSRGAIVRELASALTAQFAANLEARIASNLQTHPPAGGVPPARATVAAQDALPEVEAGAVQSQPHAMSQVPRPVQPASAPLSLQGLAWMAFKAWWGRLLHRRRPSQP
jgi:carbon monoxide dehydrogenase subunit G